ncbi:TetR/AcrR family transcriptional regulator [Hirschia baltica]|uniref:Transcriptional regulator, TetR family n=1 Tax=Hirschia baltica (strain ATCC 49814 / DSM 5838 / IFAM 1418) TaxID=582402 RepID=C6XJJ0_HIRBI|nr:TetR family transcriptional regulator [Hirschia baltica]ACT59285.1 transcriptional regulator, TetR family [Hirschia baltica ATCC 49814]
MVSTTQSNTTTDGDGISRRTRILNAGEILFSQNGFDAVTLREIAKLAEVDLALPNYYFGRKTKVFEAVFKRRAKLLNDWRLDALHKAVAEAAPNPPSIRSIMEAYLKPVLTGSHIKKPGWREYYALVAYVNNSSEWGGKLMSEFFDPMVGTFLEQLRAAYPEASEADMLWSYHCLSGALTLAFAQTGRLDTLSNNKLRSTDLQQGYETILEFCIAGFEASCGRK